MDREAFLNRMAELEAERLTVSRNSWLHGLYLAMGAGLLGGLLFLWLENVELRFIAAFLLAAVPVGYWIDARETFRNTVRQYLVDQALGSISGIRYERVPDAESLPIDEMLHLNLLPAHRKIDHLEDMVAGTHRGQSFQWVECDLTSGSGRYESTVFSGNLLAIDVPLATTGRILFAHRRGMIRNLFRQSRFGMERVASPPAALGRRHDLFADNPDEVTRILTPGLTERLLSMDRLFGTKRFVCGIHQRRIYFAVEKKIDLFEQVDMRRNLRENAESLLREVMEQVGLIHAIIEHVQA